MSTPPLPFETRKPFHLNHLPQKKNVTFTIPKPVSLNQEQKSHLGTSLFVFNILAVNLLK